MNYSRVFLLGLGSLLFTMGADKAYSREYDNYKDHPVGAESTSYGNASYGNASQDDSKMKEMLDQMDMYPFVKSEGSIPDDEVASMRVAPRSVVLFSFSGKYTKLTEGEDIKFNKVDFFSKYPELQNIELDNIDLTEERLENLQKFIPRKLRGLLLSNCRIPKARTPRLIDIIKTHKDLVSLSLFFPQCSSKKSAMLLEALEGYNNMQYVNFTFGHISGEGCKLVAELLQKSKESLRGLTIGIGEIQNDEDGTGAAALVAAIQELSGLEQLEISFLKLPEAINRDLFYAIGQYTNLKQLRLFIGNHSQYNQVNFFNNSEVLRDSIEKLENLESLDLSMMKLPGAVVQLIAQGIAPLKELKTLNISDNTIDEKSAEIFSNSFRNLDKLENFAANNCRIEAQTFAQLCRYLPNTSLKSMSLVGNKIRNGASNLPLDQMYLETIDFANNDMDYSDVKSVLDKVKLGTTLKALNFSGNAKLMRTNRVQMVINRDDLEQWRLKTFEGGTSPGIFGI